MVRVSDVMQSALVTASVDESVRSASARMDSLQLACLPVVDRDGQLVGVLTSWDVRRSHPNRLVIDALATRLVMVPSTASIWEAYERSERESVEYLPVIEENRLVGLVTRTNLAVAVARFTDALTGLPTSPYLRYQIDVMLRSGCDLCLIFFDINEFGALNKRMGHAMGDHALQVIAGILAGKIDPYRDVLCRYGGDEFAIATARSAAEAQLLARTLVQDVAKAPAIDGIFLSISGGVARRRPLRLQDSTSVDNLINLASRASTEAKRAQSGVFFLEIASGT